MAEGHSYGPTCALHESDDDQPPTGDLPPKIKAQFFYASPLPIDDPLSPVPQINADQSTNQVAQPFSSRDNAALEEAWRGCQHRQEEFKVRPGSRGLNRMFSFPKFQSGQVLTPEITSPVAESSSYAFPTVPEYRSQSRSSTMRKKTPRKTSSRSQSPTMTRKQSEKGAKLSITSETEVMLDQSIHTEGKSVAEEVAGELDLGTAKRKKYRSPMRNRRRNGSDISPPSEHTIREAEESLESSEILVPMPQFENETSISGRPFARAPSTRQILSRFTGPSPLASPKPEWQQQAPKFPQSNPSPPPEETRKAFVPVGISRLHLVEFPDMKMKPIYWSPINDTSHIIRATWFFKDTMLPIPADIANRLELGYEDMKPYSTTYQDELNACVEHGAAAELKVVYKLWPDEQRPNSAIPNNYDGVSLSQEDLPEIAENVAVDPRTISNPSKLFRSHSVIYTDSMNAQILRPNTLPSVNRNRRPLHSLRRGRQLGVAVVRGFNPHMWEKLHPGPSKGARSAHARTGAEMSQSGDATTRPRGMSCRICDEDTHKSQVSDLVLVIHGIGQKLSERVDSFHFTHAINGLRREFNVQLSQQNVQGSVKDGTGIMVLPVNWRLTVSFDEDGKQKDEDLENKYELRDITPETLPAIRSMISDVMLDIPYYLSHHQPKMIAAVVREANRVYRLWCRNNPGFETTGRVHLVAHSLGSAMAMDILSQQPTAIPTNLDLTTTAPSDTMFEFNTTNLFCCGSPSGFFLLLHNANLIPRKGRNKPGAYDAENAAGVAHDLPKYGCLAVDNLYNIMHKNDPVAYQQNACVDSQYASLLETATLPSATQSFLTRLSGSLRLSGAAPPDAYGNTMAGRPVRPGIPQMPSTVELETHNFTREEIAEKRMYMLNDNGQIDYFLSSGGGPLEIQYLNMLGAHSSYWILPDFVRFLVVEIGRPAGKDHTLEVLRARKKRLYKRGEL